MFTVGPVQENWRQPAITREQEISERFAELLVEAGLPPGVVNVVQGYGEEAGEARPWRPSSKRRHDLSTTSSGACTK